MLVNSDVYFDFYDRSSTLLHFYNMKEDNFKQTIKSILKDNGGGSAQVLSDKEDHCWIIDVD